MRAFACDHCGQLLFFESSEWLPLTYAFNAVNRSMGKEDLYPFVLAPKVIEKLSFVHELVRSVRAERSPLSTATAV